MTFRTRLVLLAIAPLLGGCPGHLPVGSIAGGECKAFERPPYVVRGVTPYDQDWADSTIEGGVGACHWQRPAARPPELDAVPAPAPKAAVVRPAKKPGVVRRLKQRVWPKTSVAPVAPMPEPPARPVADDAPAADPPLPPPDPPAPPKPRRPLTALEELLHLRPSDDE